MHHYLVDSEVQIANASEPLIPQALAGAVVSVGGLNSFAPKPRLKVTSHLTSFVTGNHYLTPGDFAAIYALNSLYAAGFDGTGQKIAIVGQSSVSTTDLNNFRTNAGLSASNVTMTLVPSNSTSAQCSGDMGESELDLEWSGGVAKGATIIFVYAGLGSGDNCNSRSNNVWNALQYAVQNDVAPFISTSYGFCESGLGAAFAAPNGTLETWAKQAQSQGQTIVAASGDAGAADCEPASSTSATTGKAVDAPGSLPEVTSAGGNEFFGDDPGTVSGTAPNTMAAATPYWGPSGTGSDGVVTALGYIPEQAWNTTTASIANHGGLAASGGGASIYYSKPSWQTGKGADGQRDVPDISLSASPDHDPYLVCSTDVAPTSCTTGFRDSSNNFTAIGGTSAAAPTFSAILALINQFLGNTPPNGLAPVNPTLYSLAASTPTAFNDVTTGNNIVPCTPGSPDCPSAVPFQFGFSAGTGFDQVTGLGSVNAINLAQAMSKAPGFSLAVTPTTYQVAQGSSVSVTVNLTPFNGFTGQVTYTCTDSVQESTCTGPATAVPSTQSASFQISTRAPTARLERPFDRGAKIFYATLFPGLLGIVLLAGSRKGASRGVRFLGLFLVLGFSTLWVASCGGSSTTKDPGTPTGSYSITITGTATINGAPVNRQVTIQLVVVA
jgi:subtilase family serine protease